jgi:histidinol-phosphate/aromatic aminotransferase/cobyric acid decarboxylase-like protein
MVTQRIAVRVATDADRRAIYGMRHDVYARELGQHHENADGRLRDGLDESNTYIVATVDDTIAGFISITSPRDGVYSLDKYLRRDEIPFALDAWTYEIRILTVLRAHRGSLVAPLLMYASLRWVEAHRGRRVIAIGRREVCGLYIKAGLVPFGPEFRSGAVAFLPMSAMTSSIRDRMTAFKAVLARMEQAADWRLLVPFHKPAECFHGGAFFDAIGDQFDHLDRSATIINADVLDAWFPPSPRVISALNEYLPWLLRTSPPIGSEGLIEMIACTRGVDPRCILPGGGSSSLIYLALREWLEPSSRVLLPEPAYGEYAHVLQRVIRCRVDRLLLSRANRYDIELERLQQRILRQHYDLIVLVNPNSPTGRHTSREELQSFLRKVPAETLVWIDETYIEYAGRDQSLEAFATTRENVVVCKSMSKVYALSGVRCAYLCASPHLLERLRSISPPWAVSLPGQVAAVAALEDPHYYAERYRQTHALRDHLSRGLSFSIPSIEVIPSVANFVLCHLPEEGPTAAAMVSGCREHNLFIRDASTMGATLGHHAIRIAVKDRQTIDRMVPIVTKVFDRARCEERVAIQRS